RHTRPEPAWSSEVCSSDLEVGVIGFELGPQSILGVHSGTGAEDFGDAVAGDHAAGTDHGLVLVVGGGGGRVAELVGASGDEQGEIGRPSGSGRRERADGRA